MVKVENKDNIVQLIGFYVGEKFFGADIMSVREILRDPAIHAIDDTPEFISGIIHLRGREIPVLDLRKRLGKGSHIDKDGQDWVLIAHVGDHVLGLVTDGVTRIFRISDSSILAAPEIILSGMARPYVQGVCESELGMLVVLDLDRLLTGDETKTLKTMDKH